MKQGCMTSTGHSQIADRHQTQAIDRLAHVVAARAGLWQRVSVGIHIVDISEGQW
jgi:hypothetical protein